MYDKVNITYLLNSGFILEIGDCAIIFDYYKDPKNIVEKIIQNKKEVYFFVSHVHYDHFNPEISTFKNKVTKYFISYDVLTDVLPKEKTIILDEYMTYDDKNIHVRSFSSTDEGISFLWKKIIGRFSMQVILTGGIGKVIQKKIMHLLKMGL